MSNKISKIAKEMKEAAFQTAYDNNDWEAIWNCVIDCCKNIMLSKCKGIVVRDIDDKALEAACKVITKIKEGERPKKLSSFCYLYAIGVLWNKKERMWDRCADYQDFANVFYTENNGDYCIGYY